MKKAKQRLQAKRKTQQRRFLFKRFAQAMSCVLVVFALAYCLIWCLEPNNFPITSVKFVGERKNASHEALRDVVLPHAREGFFRLHVRSLQHELLQVPWIKQVEVRKVWPSQLVIKFDEQQVAARWADNGLISREGVLFFPPLKKGDFDQLPVLQGPQARHLEIWQQYLVMSKTLSRAQLSITQLVLAPRGAWHVRLSNGITVFLGTNAELERLEQFLQAYEKDLKPKADKILYADLRYTSGMAIGWKRN